MSSYASLAGLPLEIRGYGLEGLALQASANWKRHTTVVVLEGPGAEGRGMAQGRGEDVTWEAEDQALLRQTGPALELGGCWTLASFAQHLGTLDLFPQPPQSEASLHYRRWAFESAALDLALRQNGISLAAALGREPAPVRFVLSMGLGEPPRAEPLRRWIAADPGARFKLDAASSWSDAFCAEVAATGAVDVVDLKGFYSGTPVDQLPEPALYERIVRRFPEAWIEDARLTEATRPVLAPHAARLAWDAPIHSVGDIEALEVAPRALNIKPSRFGTLQALLDAYDHCEREGIRCYGGGQFELGPGRGQIELLAALFHPGAPNDVAPAVYHTAEPGQGAPRSPLAPAAEPHGFGWLAATTAGTPSAG